MMLITFIFFIVGGKLFFLQIVKGKSLQARALDQWTRDVPLKAVRGSILDCNGNELAGCNTTYTLYVRPNATSSVENSARAISQVLNEDYDEILKKISKKGVSEITVAKKLSKQDMQALIDSGIDGIYFGRDIERYYRYGNYLSQLLGFVNADGDGQAGLESYYNEYLKGQDGKELTETDLVGKELSGEISYLPATDGLNLKLTIDSTIQFFAENAVNSALSEYNAKSANCVVMNAKTGAITAMAQAPSFDLNHIDRSDVSSLFSKMKLNAITSVYEPGSTFKILTTAIALSLGVVREEERFYCAGARVVDGKRIRCWKSIGHGSQTFAEGVQNSCNCVFMALAERIGVDRMYQYFEKFGLTRKTGIDCVGETSSILLNKSAVKTVDAARIGFGQAIAITPMQLIVATAAAVNGGKVVTPYLMQAVTDSGGREVIRSYPADRGRVISEQTSATVRRLLKNVVSLGSGKLAGVAGYSIGGKTGTAQKYENGRIAAGKYVSSFIGFSTVEDPEYIVYFMVDEPMGYRYYGSLVAAPYVGQIFSKIFEYKQIKPTEEVIKLTYFEMPDLSDMTAGSAITAVNRLGLHLELSGTGGRVIAQYPAAGEIVNNNSIVLLTLSED
ncbi:MAG TPA: stage V sporulation protein D [Clostridiales bacterium]|nr:stage V sporulation protein D [Clostridiales bacterium]